MDELGIHSQVELCVAADVSDPTARVFMTGKLRGGKAPQDVARKKIARALQWTPDSIDRILEGLRPLNLDRRSGADAEPVDLRELLELVRENARKLDELQELARTMNNRTYTLLDMIAQVAEVLAADEAGRSGDDPMPAVGGE